MSKHDWLIQDGDSETYQVKGSYYRVVWGYSTGSNLGCHNQANTDCAIYRWIGDEVSVENLPVLTHDDWIFAHGFDVLGDQDGYDWVDYSNKVDAFLDSV